jgi:choline-sulfatase
VFDTSLRTPTAIRWPRRIKAGTEITQTINNLDWFPTLLKLAGVELPKGLLIRGKDFSPLLADPLLTGKPVKWDNDLYVEWSQHHYTKTHLRMYRTPEWKLVRDFLNSGKDELYNLKADPDETKNLIADPKTKTIQQQLEVKLLAKMRANNDPALKK